MKLTKKTALALAGCGMALLAVGCTTTASGPGPDQQFATMMTTSFRAQGIATMDRLDQDPAQATCSGANPPDAETAKRIEAEAMVTIKPPSDGRYIGDWKKGEALAQNGRGMTWTDASAAPEANGANCYNCHQITKAEIAFGTIGPSLYNYGKLRGVTELKGPVADAMFRYTWGRLANSWAYTACSNMPRFGYKHLLNEAQMKDVMALLLDPASPVNAQ
jgi:L-cysteine S-thiosulfotransferase